MSEANYTESHSDCPNPERWTAVDEQATEIEVTHLVQAMVIALQPEIVVETGTYSAQTSTAMASALVNNGRGHLWTFEIDENRAVDAVMRLDGLPATVVNNPIQEWDPPAPIDFAWIDSGAAQTRETEIRWLIPHAHRLTVVGVHDTSYRSIQDALRRLCEEHLITYPLFLPTPRGVAFFRLPGVLQGR